MSVNYENELNKRYHGKRVKGKYYSKKKNDILNAEGTFLILKDYTVFIEDDCGKVLGIELNGMHVMEKSWGLP